MTAIARQASLGQRGSRCLSPRSHPAAFVAAFSMERFGASILLLSPQYEHVRSYQQAPIPQSFWAGVFAMTAYSFVFPPPSALRAT